MDPVHNPFSPGAGSRPPELVGRDEIIEDATIALHRAIVGRSAQSIMMLGLRGTGKTVLLNEIENLAEERNYLTSLIEAPDDKRLAHLLYPQMHSVLRKLSTVKAAKAVVHQALGGLRNFASIFKVTLGEVEIGVEPSPGTADSGNLEMDLAELFLLIGSAAQKAERGWALLIDEVQYLEPQDISALIVAMHRVSQKTLPVVFMGAGLPQIAKMSGDAKSYAERLFIFSTVGALDNEAASAAIQTPLENEKVKIDGAALKQILKQTHGYPFFLQEWGHHCWIVADKAHITEQDVQHAGELALQRLDRGFFRVRMDRLTSAETAYVIAMADLGRGPYKSNAVAAEMGKEPRALGPHRANLISKGMIYSPSYGDVDFTVPLFDQYVRRWAKRLESITEKSVKE